MYSRLMVYPKTQTHNLSRLRSYLNAFQNAPKPLETNQKPLRNEMRKIGEPGFELAKATVLLLILSTYFVVSPSTCVAV